MSAKIQEFYKNTFRGEYENSKLDLQICELCPDTARVDGKASWSRTGYDYLIKGELTEPTKIQWREVKRCSLRDAPCNPNELYSASLDFQSKRITDVKMVDVECNEHYSTQFVEDDVESATKTEIDELKHFVQTLEKRIVKLEAEPRNDEALEALKLEVETRNEENETLSKKLETLQTRNETINTDFCDNTTTVFKKEEKVQSLNNAEQHSSCLEQFALLAVNDSLHIDEKAKWQRSEEFGRTEAAPTDGTIALRKAMGSCASKPTSKTNPSLPDCDEKMLFIFSTQCAEKFNAMCKRRGSPPLSDNELKDIDDAASGGNKTYTMLELKMEWLAWWDMSMKSEKNNFANVDGPGELISIQQGKNVQFVKDALGHYGVRYKLNFDTEVYACVEIFDLSFTPHDTTNIITSHGDERTIVEHNEWNEFDAVEFGSFKAPLTQSCVESILGATQSGASSQIIALRLLGHIQVNSKAALNLEAKMVVVNCSRGIAPTNGWNRKQLYTLTEPTSGGDRKNIFFQYLVNVRASPTAYSFGETVMQRIVTQEHMAKSC